MTDLQVLSLVNLRKQVNEVKENISSIMTLEDKNKERLRSSSIGELISINMMLNALIDDGDRDS